MERTYSQLRTGVLHLMHTLMLSSLSGLKDCGNSPITKDTLMDSSGHCATANMRGSLITTEPSAPVLRKQEISFSTSQTNTPSSKIYGLEEPALSHPQKPVPLLSQFSDQKKDHLKHVTSTILAPVTNPNETVASGMFARNVIGADTSKDQASAMVQKISKGKKRSRIKEVYPKYARDFLWEEDRRPSFQTSADLSEQAMPLPLPPERSELHPDLLRTVDDNPELFKIVTPVNVDKLEYLLSDHPNRPFVQSVVRMMREGAWPWARTPTLDFPIINDQSQDNSIICQSPDKFKFFEDESQKEIDAGRYSPPFPTILPGMACMPTYVIERKNKMRLITEQTCISDPSKGLNSLVKKENCAVPLCNLQQFGYDLRTAKEDSYGWKLVIWKCDVKGAYRLIPMHPFWQILQAANLPDGSYTINRCNVFGGGASGRCWWSLMSLILWIARCHFGSNNLNDYIDNVFLSAYANSLVLYSRYMTLMPPPQASFLQCLDVIEVPHDRVKQLWNSSLPVTGLVVDADQLLITMPEESKTRLATSSG